MSSSKKTSHKWKVIEVKSIEDKTPQTTEPRQTRTQSDKIMASAAKETPKIAAELRVVNGAKALSERIESKAAQSDKSAEITKSESLEVLTLSEQTKKRSHKWRVIEVKPIEDKLPQTTEQCQTRTQSKKIMASAAEETSKIATEPREFNVAKAQLGRSDSEEAQSEKSAEITESESLEVLTLSEQRKKRSHKWRVIEVKPIEDKLPQTTEQCRTRTQSKKSMASAAEETSQIATEPNILNVAKAQLGRSDSEEAQSEKSAEIAEKTESLEVLTLSEQTKKRSHKWRVIEVKSLEDKLPQTIEQCQTRTQSKKSMASAAEETSLIATEPRVLNEAKPQLDRSDSEEAQSGKSAEIAEKTESLEVLTLSEQRKKRSHKWRVIEVKPIEDKLPQTTEQCQTRTQSKKSMASAAEETSQIATEPNILNVAKAQLDRSDSEEAQSGKSAEITESESLEVLTLSEDTNIQFGDKNRNKTMIILKEDGDSYDDSYQISLASHMPEIGDQYRPKATTGIRMLQEISTKRKKNIKIIERSKHSAMYKWFRKPKTTKVKPFIQKPTTPREKKNEKEKAKVNQLKKSVTEFISRVGNALFSCWRI